MPNNQEDLNRKLNYLNETKQEIKKSLKAKGQPVNDNTTFREYANLVNNITTGTDTDDATATADDILFPKTAYVKGQKIEGGIIPIYEYKGSIEKASSIINNTSYVVRSIVQNKYALLSSSTAVYIYDINNNRVNSLLISISLSSLNASGTLLDADMASVHISNTENEYYIAILSDRDTDFASRLVRVNLSTKTYIYLGGYNYGYGANKVNGGQLRFFSNSSNHFCIVRYHKFGYSNTVHLQTYNIDQNTNDIISLPEQTWNIGNWGSYSCTSGSLLTLLGDYACIQSMMTAGTSYNNYSNCLFKIDWMANTISTLIQSTTDKICLTDKYLIRNRDLYSLLNLNTKMKTLSNYKYDNAYGYAVGYGDVIVSFSPTDHLYYIYNLSEDNELSLISSNSYVTDNRFLINKGNLCVPKFDEVNLFFTTSSNTGEDVNLLKYNINSEIPISFEFDDYKLFNTKNATATSKDILLNKTAFAGDSEIAGTMPNNGTLNITPSKNDQSLPLGYIDGGTINGDVNLVPENIIEGKTIFGVQGNATGSQLRLVQRNIEYPEGSNVEINVYDSAHNKIDLLGNNSYLISTNPVYIQVEQNRYKYNEQEKSITVNSYIDTQVSELTNILTDDYENSNLNLTGTINNQSPSYSSSGTLTFNTIQDYKGLYTNGSSYITYSLNTSISSYDVQFDFYKANTSSYSRVCLIQGPNYEIEIKGSSNLVYWNGELNGGWIQNEWNILRLHKSGNNVQLYINNKLIATKTYSAAITGIRFGRGNDSGNYFTGYYKNVVITDNSKTLEQPIITISPIGDIIDIVPKDIEQQIAIPEGTIQANVSAIDVTQTQYYKECLELSNQILGN